MANAILSVLLVPFSLLCVSGSALAASDTVVLLHGLGRGPWGMKLLELRLEREGYTVHNLGYDKRAASIEEAAASIHDQLQDCCAEAERVHFVTHSLGGIVLRSLFQNYSVPNAGRAVLLAPPNAGTELVDKFGQLRLFSLALGPLGSQLGTQPEQLPSLLPPPPIPFGVIAGNHSWNPIGAAILPGPDDGVVTVEATRLPGMADHLVVPHTHSFLMNSSRVAKAVSHFLSAGRFPHPEETSVGTRSRSLGMRCSKPGAA